MKNKIIYTDEPMKFRIIKDFLPKPEDLVLKITKRKPASRTSKNRSGFRSQEAGI